MSSITGTFYKQYRKVEMANGFLLGESNGYFPSFCIVAALQSLLGFIGISYLTFRSVGMLLNSEMGVVGFEMWG